MGERRRARAGFVAQAVHDIKLAFDNVGFGSGSTSTCRSSVNGALHVDEVLAAAAQAWCIRGYSMASASPTDTCFPVSTTSIRRSGLVADQAPTASDRLTLALERLLPAEGDSVRRVPPLWPCKPDPTRDRVPALFARAARGDIGGALKIYKSLGPPGGGLRHRTVNETQAWSSASSRCPT
jgi:hypothetical protein